MHVDPFAALRAQADRLEAYGGPLVAEAAALRATIQDLEQTTRSDPPAAAQLRTERDQERARLAAVLEHLPVGLILVDAATTAITHYNVQAAHLLGHAMRPTRTLADFAAYHGVHPDGRPYAPHEYPLAQALAGQIVHAAPVWYQVDETQRRLLHVTAAPIADGTGAITMAVAIFVDMTEHDLAGQERLRLLAQAQAAQAQAEAERTHLYRLLEQAPAAICLVQGPDFRYTLANTTYCQLLGRPRSAVEGALVRTVFPEYVAQGLLIKLHDVWTTGRPYYGHDERVQVTRPTDGVLEDRYFTFVYAPISDGAGTITHIFAHGVEVSGLVRARQDADHAVQLRDQFLSIAAHELRTPVTTLLGYADLLHRRATRGMPTDARSHKAIDQLLGQTQRLARLVETLLDVSRLNLGRLQLHLQTLDLSALLSQVVDALRITLSQHTITLICTVPTLAIVGDAQRLEQVIVNLLQNAIKYSPDGGTITVTLTATVDQACLVVTDQGIGIPAAALPHVFARFARIERPGMEGIGGMGLGLFVVHDLVTLHGGTITVTSQEGVGSTFTVCLPCSGPPPARAAEVDHCPPTMPLS